MDITSIICSVDFSLMHKVQRWSAPRWVRVWMICATRGGDGWLWYAMALWIVLFGGSDKWLALGAMLSSIFTGTALYLLVKKATKRKRPCHIEAHCWSTLLPPDQFSFPSGHTISAFAATVPLCAFYPELTAPLGFCALSVALSRIILGMHFLSDVLVGAAVGSLLGWLAIFVWY